jgi:hypothetical protein
LVIRAKTEKRWSWDQNTGGVGSNMIRANVNKLTKLSLWVSHFFIATGPLSTIAFSYWIQKWIPCQVRPHSRLVTINSGASSISVKSCAEIFCIVRCVLIDISCHSIPQTHVCAPSQLLTVPHDTDNLPQNVTATWMLLYGNIGPLLKEPSLFFQYCSKSGCFIWDILIKIFFKSNWISPWPLRYISLLPLLFPNVYFPAPPLPSRYLKM